MSAFVSIQSKLSGHVIDIQQASKTAGAHLDAFPLKSTNNDNQMWDFVADPAGSGYYFIKSKLCGNVIDIQQASTKSGALLDAFPQKSSGTDNQLWSFNPDPAGSDFHFIRNKMTGHVVDIQQASKEAGALLDAFSQKTSGSDNQLWKAVGGEFPAPVFSSISWGPEGTGPAPNSPPTGSGGTKCAYQVSVSINQNGSCTFSGYYQNRGDTIGTAPPQAFVVVFFVYDTTGKAYYFSHSGEIPSAPQDGSLVTWSVTKTCPVIAENWFAIAAKNAGTPWVYRSYDESVWQFILGEANGVGKWLESAASDIGTAVQDIAKAFENGEGLDGGGDPGGDGDDSDAIVTKPSLKTVPSGLPGGTAATLHEAGTKIVGVGKK